MKTLPAGMQADLDSGATTLCWAWRITRGDGEVFGFTDHDRALSFDGTDFEPDSGFIASEIRATSDLAVDAQDAEGALTSERITETDILDGRWDNAQVEVFRVDWTNPAKRILMRLGSIGQVRRGVTAFAAEIRSLTHLLNTPVGRTYQTYCDVVELGDARCKVDIDDPAFSADGEIDAVDTDRSFTAVAGLEGYDDGWFSLGTIEWSTGANAGRRAEVATHVLASGVVTIELEEKPVRPLSAGDTFHVIAGCDRLRPTCRIKFNNIENYRGFSRIPPAEVIAVFSSADDPNTGGSLTGGGT
jgi:uncharacterized phage protein (TIGR02218 family)